MKLAAIQFPVFNPYQKAAIEIYISGCKAGCVNCHNKELQNFNYGKNLDIEELIGYLKVRELFFDIISITGGDLYFQDEIEAMHLCSTLKLCFPDKELWLFTGAELNQVPNWYLKIFTYIKSGVYDENVRQEGFPASRNQKLNQIGKDY
jgi:organic radical activating enzyme